LENVFKYNRNRNTVLIKMFFIAKKMWKQKIDTEIENVISRWDETKIGNGDFCVRSFLLQNMIIL
jgi:hypothetical protein